MTPGDSHIKRKEVLVGILNRIPKRYQNPALGAGLKFYFSFLRGTNLKTTHCLLSYFFPLNTQKGTAKPPAVDLLTLSTLRGTKTTFLTPKRNDEHPPGYDMVYGQL